MDLWSKIMTRTEAKERRRRIAGAMRQNKRLADVAKEFGVSHQLVRKACREHGVRWSEESSSSKRLSKKQVAADLRTGKQPEALAEQYKVPIGRIVRVQKRIASGLPSGSN
jgi:transposase-like protein